LLYLIVFTGCAGLIGTALVLEHWLGQEPCSLCMLQRVMVVATGLLALAAAVHDPGPFGTRAYAIACGLSAAGGAGLALRQLWLQSLPEDQVPACGPSLDYMLEAFPMQDVLRMMLQGDGSCAEVSWTLAGLSIPGWTLIAFTGLIAICAVQALRPLDA
jgi:disulfide bond formation protein DsbB